MIRKETNRGFALFEFDDRYGVSCTIQKSSLATEDAIWFGVNEPNPRVMASHAATLGVDTEEKVGWVPYPIPEDVLINTRMHLTRNQVRMLLPVLQKFVDTGEI